MVMDEPHQFAMGGLIVGQPRDNGDDTVTIRVSQCLYESVPSEFMARHRAMLDAINAGGTIPPFTTGGVV